MRKITTYERPTIDVIMIETEQICNALSKVGEGKGAGAGGTILQNPKPTSTNDGIIWI